MPQLLQIWCRLLKFVFLSEKFSLWEFEAIELVWIWGVERQAGHQHLRAVKHAPISTEIGKQGISISEQLNMRLSVRKRGALVKEAIPKLLEHAMHLRAAGVKLQEDMTL